jgi:hypothetical protein
MVKFFILMIFFSIGIIFSYALELSVIPIYLFSASIMLYFYRPIYLISPLTIIHLYYFVFFAIAPIFAQRHYDDDFAVKQAYLIYGMVFLTYLFATLGAVAGGKHVANSVINNKFKTLILDKWILRFIAISLFILCTFFVVMIILASGGFGVWIESPGQAFLNRAGSGVYVMFSNFFLFLLSGFVGYYAFTRKNKKTLIIFFVWLFITSPVHGSKALLIIAVTLVLLPWLKDLKLLSKFSFVFATIALSLFFLGLYFRNHAWMTLADLIPYSLNYFTALSNMMILVADFEPNFMQTFFLPFNKFLTPFGLSDPSLYYDMNHYLTDIYFPTAWEIRATEQWPVEADLYLNFYFFFGLPLIYGYFFIISLIHGKAERSASLGLWVVCALLIFTIPSHLRGSLYNHVDFYQYPMFFVVYLILRNFRLEDKDLK